MAYLPNNKKAVLPWPKMSWTFGIFCSTNPLLTEKDHNVQNCWAKAKHSPKYGHWFWLSHVQNRIFGHFTLRLGSLHSLMFFSCSGSGRHAMPISVSVNIHDFRRSNFYMTWFDEFFSHSPQNILQIKRGQMKKGAVKMIKVVKSPLESLQR